MSDQSRGGGRHAGGAGGTQRRPGAAKPAPRKDGKPGAPGKKAAVVIFAGNS